MAITGVSAISNKCANTVHCNDIKGHKALPKEVNLSAITMQQSQLNRPDFDCGEGNNYEYFNHFA